MTRISTVKNPSRIVVILREIKVDITTNAIDGWAFKNTLYPRGVYSINETFLFFRMYTETYFKHTL